MDSEGDKRKRINRMRVSLDMTQDCSQQLHENLNIQKGIPLSEGEVETRRSSGVLWEGQWGR